MGKCVVCESYCKDEYYFCSNCFNIIAREDIGIFAYAISEIFPKLYEIKNKTKRNYIESINKSELLCYKCDDGHYVRSRGEKIIDDFLYKNRIVHAYENKICFEENYLYDFYLPEKDVYIEFWGIENNENYIKNRKEKQYLYSKQKKNVISLEPEDIKDIENIITKEINKFKNINIE